MAVDTIELTLTQLCNAHNQMWFPNFEVLIALIVKLVFMLQKMEVMGFLCTKYYAHTVYHKCSLIIVVDFLCIKHQYIDYMI